MQRFCVGGSKASAEPNAAKFGTGSGPPPPPRVQEQEMGLFTHRDFFPLILQLRGQAHTPYSSGAVKEGNKNHSTGQKQGPCLRNQFMIHHAGQAWKYNSRNTRCSSLAGTFPPLCLHKRQSKWYNLINTIQYRS